MPLAAAFYLAGYALQRWVIDPASHGDHGNTLLATLGLSIVIENLLLASFSADTRSLGTDSAFDVIPVGPMLLSRPRLIRASGSRGDRAGLAKALAFLHPGDCLVVWKLDRLGRSLPHLLTTVGELKTRGVAFRSLTEQMDTTTPHGEFLFHIFGALAQFERSLIQERVQAGLAAARRLGRRGGRPASIDAEKLAAVTAALDGGATKAAVCRTFGIKRSTLIDSLTRIGWSAGLKGQEA